MGIADRGAPSRREWASGYSNARRGPHEVFGAVQATSDRLDILINNAGIGTASPRQTSAEEFETEPWPVGIFRRLLSSKFRFARDSLLEGDGFELSVPRVMGGRFRTTVPAAIAVASCCVQLPKKTNEDPVASDRD